MAIFALNIMPYISASAIIMQLMSSVDKRRRSSSSRRRANSGRKQINQYTRYLHRAARRSSRPTGIAIGLAGLDLERRPDRHRVRDWFFIA